MKKTLLGTLLLASTILLTAPAFVQAQEVIGENSGKVDINGLVGVDNTNPDEPNIPEESDAWINVTLPDMTTFISTSKEAKASITSPTYDIINNSGRGVKVTIAEVKNDGPVLDLGITLNFNGKAKTNGVSILKPQVPLVVDNLNQVPNADIATLKAVSAKGVSDGGAMTFSYSGNVGKAITKLENPKYDMILKFTALPK